MSDRINPLALWIGVGYTAVAFWDAWMLHPLPVFMVHAAFGIIGFHVLRIDLLAKK